MKNMTRGELSVETPRRRKSDPASAPIGCQISAALSRLHIPQAALRLMYRTVPYSLICILTSSSSSSMCLLEAMSTFCPIVLATILQLVVCHSLQQPGVNGTGGLAMCQVLATPLPYYFPEHNDTASLFPMETCKGITLEEATIDQLQNHMTSGKLTASQLVMCYLQRQHQTDGYVEYVFRPLLSICIS